MKVQSTLILLSTVATTLAFTPNSHHVHQRTHTATNTNMSTKMASNSNIEEDSEIGSRRELFSSAWKGATLVAMPLLFTGKAQALDMDAFMNAEIAKDTNNCDPKRDPKCIPKLTQDEALCKYGQSGNARQDACKRVKESGKELPSASSGGKSLGGAYAM